jgi:hypothetical protein
MLVGFASHVNEDRPIARAGNRAATEEIGVNLAFAPWRMYDAHR